VQVAYTDLKTDETHMLQKFYTMLQKTDIKSFKLKVAMISSKTGAVIAESPADTSESQANANPEMFQSTVPNLQ